MGLFAHATFRFDDLVHKKRRGLSTALPANIATLIGQEMLMHQPVQWITYPPRFVNVTCCPTRVVLHVTCAFRVLSAGVTPRIVRQYAFVVVTGHYKRFKMIQNATIRSTARNKLIGETREKYN